MDYYSLFWGPGVISKIDEPRVHLRVGHQHPQFWPILTHFVDYYSLFWGPGVISMIDEPRGAFTFRSSTPAVLADPDPFRGLLLTVLRSQSDFHDRQTRGAFTCRSSTLEVLTDFVLFHGLLLTVLVSRTDFHD